MRSAPGHGRVDARLAWSVATGAVAVALVSLLVVANYRSARTLRENLLALHAHEVRLRAASVAHLLDSAKERLQNLAASREVAAFHENQDLGMSMQYGLGLSLVPIRERLAALSGDGATFVRVTLLDAAGAPLADSGAARDAPSLPGGAATVLRLDDGAEGLQLVVPYRFKGHAGTLVGWLRPGPVLDALGPATGGAGARLLDAAGRAWPAAGVPLGTLLGADGGVRAAAGAVTGLAAPGGDRLVAIDVPVEGYPFSLVWVDREAELLGHLSSTGSAVTLGAAVLLVLAAVAVAVFLNTRALVLGARLEESILREREVQEKHRALEQEVAERQRLERSQALLARAVDQAGEAIAVTGPDKRFTYVNPAFERITQYPVSEIIGRTPRELSPEVFDGRAGQSLREAVRTDQPWKGELPARRMDGAQVMLEVVVSPVHDADGTTVSHVTVARDVSEERRLFEQLRRAQQLEAVGTLAGGVAHDFNNLLSVIGGNASVALEVLGEGHPAREELSEVLVATRRAAELTRQLLAFGSRQAHSPRIVDLGASIASVEKMARRVIRENVELRVLPAPGPLPVRADPGQLEQVLMNMLVNARDALPGGGHIEVSAVAITLSAQEARRHPGAAPGSWIRLRVRDDGAGMSQETLQRLFEPFYTTKGIGKGTGLGLAVAYGIVRQSRGFIEVTSQLGQGATFEVFLPAAGEVPAVVEPPPPAHPGNAPPCQGTVLVVEDEPQLLRLLRQRLTAEGFRVLEARDGEEALATAAAHPERIDLLLTDVVMPRLGGPALAERLAADRPETRVVFMSGHASEAMDPKGRVRRAAAFVEKPGGLDDVPALLRRLLEEPRLDQRGAPASPGSGGA